MTTRVPALEPPPVKTITGMVHLPSKKRIGPEIREHLPAAIAAHSLTPSADPGPKKIGGPPNPWGKAAERSDQMTLALGQLRVNHFFHFAENLH